jgi:hypothetical protein
MFHFIDGFLLDVFGEAYVFPVLTHLGVKEVLVDGEEFLAERFVERGDDLGVTLHAL